MSKSNASAKRKAALKAPASGGQKWTPEMDAGLFQGRVEGLILEQIAARLGVTLCAARGRLSRLRRAGTPVPPISNLGPRDCVQATGVRQDGRLVEGWTPDQTADLIESYDVQGLTVAQIAARLQRSKQAVATRVMRLRVDGQIKTHRRIDPRLVKWSPARLDELRARWCTVPHAVLARELGVTTPGLLSMAYRLGLPARKPGRPKGVVSTKTTTVRKPRVRSAKPVAIAAPTPRPKSAPKAVVVQAMAVALVEQKSEPKCAAPEQTFQVARGAGRISAPLRGWDFARPVARFMPGMTDRQKADAVAAHIEGLFPEPQFTEEEDLALCEVVFAGRGIEAAAEKIRVERAAALARFNAIVAPMRNPDMRGLPIEAAAWTLPPLRARAGRAA